MKGSQLFISKATEFFSQLDKRAMFITIHDYHNNFNEVATHSLCWHVNYGNAVQKSYDIINDFKPSIKFCLGRPYTLFDLEAAHTEWLESLADSIVLRPGNNPRATSAHVYDAVLDSKGKRISGIKIHRKNQTIHLTDVYRINKIVHTPGIYPSTASARKTLAKNDLRQLTPLRKWGQFVLDLGRFRTMTVNKITIKEQDIIANWAQV